MFEGFYIRAEKDSAFIQIFLMTFLITFILGIANYFIFKNVIFYVLLVSLALAFPIITFIKNQQKELLEKKIQTKKLLFLEINDLILFWAIFLGLVIGFILSFNIFTNVDYSIYQGYITEIKGNITETHKEFTQILLNNLKVGIITFILSFLFLSGFVLVLVFNASVFAYYLSKAPNYVETFITLLTYISHALLEIGGYMFLGIAGAILSYRLDLKNFKINNFEFKLEFFYLILLGLIFIFLGAIIEVL